MGPADHQHQPGRAPRGVLTDTRADEQLLAELAAVEDRHPGWHAFLSDERRSWATRVHHADGMGCGITLDANSPSLLDWVITAWEHADTGSAA